jgi:hypothetical protein
MALTRDERRAIIKWAATFTEGEFNAFLYPVATVRAKDFSKEGPLMGGVAVDFVVWLDRNIKQAPEILEAAAAEFPNALEAPVFSATAQRLRQAEAKLSLLAPHEAILVEGVPIVDRAPLRQCLREVVDVGFPSVIIVPGTSGLGRSHSWYLIEYVARQTGRAIAHLADFLSADLANATLREVFAALVRDLDLKKGTVPTDIGAKPDTLAGRYAAEFASRLRLRPANRPPIWLVFDSLDNERIPVKPEVQSFVAELAQMRMANKLHRCIIFLLAPDPMSEPPDPLLRTGRAPVSAFSDEEIEEAAERINALGANRLSDGELRSRIEAIQALGPPNCREFCAAVAVKLAALRQEVGA